MVKLGKFVQAEIVNVEQAYRDIERNKAEAKACIEGVLASMQQDDWDSDRILQGLTNVRVHLAEIYAIEQALRR